MVKNIIALYGQKGFASNEFEIEKNLFQNFHAIEYDIYEIYHRIMSKDTQQVGCSKFRYKSDIKSARIQLVKLLTFNTLYCEIVL